MFYQFIQIQENLRRFTANPFISLVSMIILFIIFGKTTVCCI